MRLYHVSPTRNHASIGEQGINPDYSQGLIQACWYVTRRKLEWAILHVCLRHKIGLGDVTVYAVNVDRRRVVRRRKCTYTLARVLGTADIVQTYSAADISGLTARVGGEGGTEPPAPDHARAQAPRPDVTSGGETGGQP